MAGHTYLSGMTPFPSLVFGGIALMLVWATAWFGVSVVLRRNDIADVAWGPGFIALALYLLLLGEADSRDLLLTGLVGIWGVRLALHIGLRNRGKEEDFRYRNWREAWGRTVLVRSYLQVFLLQGMIAVVIAAPLFLSAAGRGPSLDGWAVVGMLAWGVGFAFEAIGDEQLRSFRADPAHRDRILTTGLRRYTRHPNYFGEALLWWGIFLIVVPVEHGPWAIISPLLLTFLLLRVSGVPMLEARYEGHPEWEAYRARTSPFIPWPPRR